MELRVLEYFVTIARLGNMSRAAELLNVSQPTLSKQLKQLEDELNKKLFTRVASGIILTEEGMLLKKRAEDILDMVQKTTDDFRNMNELLGGDVHIGCAESFQMRHIARVIKKMKEKYPLFKYHLLSGTSEQVLERLERGILDFAILVEPPDISRYNYLELPGVDKVGVVLLKNHPYADNKEITYKDLQELDLLASRQMIEKDLPRWCGDKTDKLKISGTNNLFYNGTVFVREGLGALITFEHLLDITKDSPFVYLPLSPALEIKLFIVWRKHQVFSPIVARFHEALKTAFA